MPEVLQERVLLELQELVQAVRLVVAVHGPVAVADCIRPRPEPADLGVHLEAPHVEAGGADQGVDLGHAAGAGADHEHGLGHGCSPCCCSPRRGSQMR